MNMAMFPTAGTYMDWVSCVRFVRPITLSKLYISETSMTT